VQEGRVPTFKAGFAVGDILDSPLQRKHVEDCQPHTHHIDSYI